MISISICQNQNLQEQKLGKAVRDLDGLNMRFNEVGLLGDEDGAAESVEVSRHLLVGLALHVVGRVELDVAHSFRQNHLEGAMGEWAFMDWVA